MSPKWALQGVLVEYTLTYNRKSVYGLFSIHLNHNINGYFSQ